MEKLCTTSYKCTILVDTELKGVCVLGIHYDCGHYHGNRDWITLSITTHFDDHSVYL